MKGIEFYSGSDVDFNRIDIRGMACLSVDLRAVTGMGTTPDFLAMQDDNYRELMLQWLGVAA